MKRVLIAMLLAAPFLHAEDARPVIAILPFESSVADSGETDAIEKLVQSYVSEIGDFRIVTPSDREKALSEQEFAAMVSAPEQTGSRGNALVAAQYLLSGSIGVLGEERVLTLEALKVKTGEKKSVSSVHRNMSELVLGLRTLVMQVLEKGEQGPSAGQSSKTASKITEENLIGTWNGDKGIELVRIFRGGKAIAVFSSGVRMDLFYRIQGDEVRFAQTSPNNARYYLPVPYAVAQKLVQNAQPMQWTFKLSEDGITLRGNKISTGVEYEGDSVRRFVPDAARNAEWSRAAR